MRNWMLAAICLPLLAALGCNLAGGGLAADQNDPDQLAQFGPPVPVEPAEGEPVPVEPAEGDANDDEREPKSRFVRRLLNVLDSIEAAEISDEERGLLRDSLLDADGELHRNLGGNSLNRIMRANNNRSRHFIVSQPTADAPVQDNRDAVRRVQERERAAQRRDEELETDRADDAPAAP